MEVSNLTIKNNWAGLQKMWSRKRKVLLKEAEGTVRSPAGTDDGDSAVCQ
jgi:hypothetical protein